jgi:hypothetical protein
MIGSDACQNLLTAFLDSHQLWVLSPEEETAPMFIQGKPQSKVGFPAATCTAIPDNIRR